MVAPLTNLLSPKVRSEWTPQCRQAFENVKGLITSAPVLAAPRLDEPFQLQVDVSNVCAGDTLLQTDPDAVEHPVSFFSKKFSSAELLCGGEGGPGSYLGLTTF